MTAIILAAGRGRRLGAGHPKCLLEIGGRSLLHRQLATFQTLGVQRYVIVVGFRQQEVRHHLKDQPGEFLFIDNPRFAETNTLYSLYLARQYFAGGFYYTNGDVLFDRRLTGRLAAGDDGTHLAVKQGRFGQEEVKVIVEEERILRIGKQLDPARAYGEFLGVARFGGDIVPAFNETLRHCVEEEGVVGDHFERALDRLCDHHVITPVDISDLPCGEIDFPEDLEIARRDIAPHLID